VIFHASRQGSFGHWVASRQLPASACPDAPTTVASSTTACNDSVDPPVAAS
jgi:hypothetical protein